MSTIPFPVRRDEANIRAVSVLDIPGPRIWDAGDLAKFLRVGKSWVYKRTQANAEDPPPRCPGIGPLRFDTASPQFRAWIARQLGYVDGSEVDE